MNPENLGIVTGPALYEPPLDPIADMKLSQVVGAVIRQLILRRSEEKYEE